MFECAKRTNFPIYYFEAVLPLAAARRFRATCRAIAIALCAKMLDPERLESLMIHHGRNTLIAHALAGGRTLAEVRDAAAPDAEVRSDFVAAS
jgi:hypothetical protein